MGHLVYFNDRQGEALFNLLDAYLRTEAGDIVDDLADLAEVRAKLNDKWAFQDGRQLGAYDANISTKEH